MSESRNRREHSGLFFILLVLCAGVTLSLLAQHAGDLGFDDTPYLPGGKWRVHDSKRPRPTVITPGTCSTPEQPGRPPSDAIVLFDGKDLSQWQNLTQDGKLKDPAWKVEDGYMEVVGGAGSLVTRQKFGDCQLHVEWASPAEVKGTSQGRGNSGVILMSHYEIQVLDTYDNLTYADGGAAAMYGQYPPLVNACRKPGQWQTYDIIFEAPKFDGDKIVKPAYVTVFHNGVVVHNHQAFIGAMVWRQLATYHPHPEKEPLLLQDHGNPVRYRNIWIRPIGTYN